MTNNINPNFCLKPVADLLDGTHRFVIPSFQRGYRWEKSQIEDLLKDISDYARDTRHTDAPYCLQPIVLKPIKDKDGNDAYNVIDGQQRLTTLYLICSYLKNPNIEDAYVRKAQLYSIKYSDEGRDEISMDEPVPAKDIDSYYIANAKQIIHDWFQTNDRISPSDLRKVLFLRKDPDRDAFEPHVAFIWYVLQNAQSQDDIKVFNNLNKGKIRLTNAELIKALFILDLQKPSQPADSIDENAFAYQWDTMEHALNDDRFWYFIANKNYNPATRIEIIFDFITDKKNLPKKDHSYRCFQDLFDGKRGNIFKEKNITSFGRAWEEIRKIFETFRYWYEEGSLYHYIGFLISCDIPLYEIFEKLDSKSKSEMVREVRNMIRTRIFGGGFKEENLRELTYSSPKMTRHTLLLFNIETHVRAQQNQSKNAPHKKGVVKSNVTFQKFPFDLFKLYNWDVEHIDSQNESKLQKPDEKCIWLSYVGEIHDTAKPEEWVALQKEAKVLYDKMKEQNEDKENEFKNIYSKVVSFLRGDESDGNVVVDSNIEAEDDDKNPIYNLTLLDAKTNRSYQNAPFAYKRKEIIRRDMSGVFIPTCTKNLFLKYYTRDAEQTSVWKNRWTTADRNGYMAEMINMLKWLWTGN